MNSDHIHFEAYRDTILEFEPTFNGGQPITREYYDAEMSGRQNPELVRCIFPDMPLERQTTLWMTKEKRYEDVIASGVPPIAGLPEMLDFCDERGIMKFIVTNAPKETCMLSLRAIGLRERFGSNIVVAEECEFPKPHPAPYLKALKLAGLNADEVVVFEDSPSGMKSALAAGIVTIGMLSTQSEELLRGVGATLCVHDYTSSMMRDTLTEWSE